MKTVLCRFLLYVIDLGYCDNDQMNETAELAQELSLVENDPCKLKLQTREHTRRGLEEESRE